MIIRLLLLLISLYGLMLLVDRVRFMHKKTIPFLTIALLMVGLYFGGILKVLMQTSVFFYSLGILSYIYYWYEKLVREQRALLPLLKSYLNSPLFLFGILFVVNWAIFNDYYLSWWDEFSFWGYFGKILASFHDINAGFSNINKADYPRASALLGYYFNFFVNNGTYKESIAILSQVTIISSAISVFLCESLRKNKLIAVLIIVAYYCSYYIFLFPIYLIYNDSLLALFWGMSIILYLISQNKTKGILLSSIPVFCLIQIKETGLIFAAGTVFIIAIDYLFFETSPKFYHKIKHLSLLLLVVIVSKFSWSLYKSNQRIEVASFEIDSSSINLTELEDYQKATAKNYLLSLVHVGDLGKTQSYLSEKGEDRFIAAFAKPFQLQDKFDAINKIFGTNIYEPGPRFLYKIHFSLSPVVWGIIFMFFWYRKHKADQHQLLESKKEWAFIGSIWMVIVGYICLLLVLYLYSFIPWEAVRLASFGRYIGTFYQGLFLIILYQLVRSHQTKLVIYMLIFVLLFTLGEALESFAPRENVHSYQELHNIYSKIDPVYAEINKLDENKKAKVFMIHQNTDGGLFVKARYRAFPLDLNGELAWSFTTRPMEGWAIESEVKSQQDFRNILAENKYLIVWNDQEFWEMYGAVVKEADLKGIWRLQNNTFVKVENFDFLQEIPNE